VRDGHWQGHTQYHDAGAKYQLRGKRPQYCESGALHTPLAREPATENAQDKSDEHCPEAGREMDGHTSRIIQHSAFVIDA
jgi:hypothetical protein